MVRAAERGWLRRSDRVYYRGYERSARAAERAGLLADARAFLAAARAEANGRTIWVVGHSLGGGVRWPSPAPRNSTSLVTIGTFTRLRDMAPRLVAHWCRKNIAMPMLSQHSMSPST
jgi:predicted alpha/beta-fold hydrolase